MRNPYISDAPMAFRPKSLRGEVCSPGVGGEHPGEQLTAIVPSWELPSESV